MQDTIELFTCESGDWKILKINGEVCYSSHEISEYIWLAILETLGYKVSATVLSDEEMEEMC